MKQFDKITAIFKPRNTSDLVRGAAEYIGKELHFAAAWKIEDGEYAGEWAMQVIEDTPFAWIPSGDLEVVA